MKAGFSGLRTAVGWWAEGTRGSGRRVEGKESGGLWMTKLGVG